MFARIRLACAIFTLTGAMTMATDAPPYYVEPAPAVCPDCVTHSCKLAPDVKQIKKTVYEVQEVPFCVKKLPPILSLFRHHGCCDQCGACDECQCPRYKKVLVKKEIVCKEICTTKCVVEEHRVPCQVCEPTCK